MTSYKQLLSVMWKHYLDSYPDRYLTFHFDADLDLNHTCQFDKDPDPYNQCKSGSITYFSL
jgi:hypothetical protein